MKPAQKTDRNHGGQHYPFSPCKSCKSKTVSKHGEERRHILLFVSDHGYLANNIMSDSPKEQATLPTPVLSFMLFKKINQNEQYISGIFLNALSLIITALST